MKKFAGPLAFAALLALAPALAQSPSGEIPPAQQKGQKGEPDGKASGTAPDSMGSSGWTGPHKGDHTGTDQESADQSLTATGKDLKGQPKRFTPGETPQ